MQLYFSIQIFLHMILRIFQAQDMNYLLNVSVATEEHAAKKAAEAVPHPLTQIVERWGGLSDELKRAVLAVVGSHLLI